MRFAFVVLILLSAQWSLAQSEDKGSVLTALEKAKSNGDLAQQAQLQYQLGQMSLAVSDTDNALQYFYAALDIYQQTNDKQGAALSKTGLGKVYLQQGDIARAISLFKEARDGLSGPKQKAEFTEVTGWLGRAYLEKNPAEYGTAKKYLSEAFRGESELGHSAKAAQIAKEIVRFDIELKDYDSALVYLRAMMEIYQSENDAEHIAETYHTMASVQHLRKDYSLADKLYQKAFSIREEKADSLGIARSLLAMGWNEWEAGNKAQARPYFDRTAKVVQGLEVKAGIPELCKSLSLAMETTGDTEQALFWQKKYATTKDEYLGMEKQRAILDLTAMYESKFEMEEIRNKNEQYQLQQRNMRTSRNFLLALFALALLLLIVLYNGYQRKKRDNQILQEKNAEIQSMNGKLEKLNQRLVKEMADRESIEQFSFARDRFLAMMSNNMRNPLNIINGLSQLLLSQDPKPNQVTHLRTLQYSANNLAVFINDVLDFSNIEAGKISFDAVNFQPKTIFRDLKQHFHLPCKEKNMELQMSFSAAVPDDLRGDPSRLEQVMSNIVSAMLEDAQDGKIEFTIDAESMDTQPLLDIQIKDEKHTLRPAQLQVLNKETSSGEIPAALSGLFVSRRLVELQGGKIEFTSDKTGTYFHIRLPYKQPVQEVQGQDNSPQAPADFNHLSGQKILLVEDNKINQLVVAKILKKCGVEIVVAGHGKEGLKRMGEQYFDLVLMDIQMPVMDGYRTTAEIRKSTDPKVRDVPIIALTASAYLSEKDKARLFGMDDHVGKPFAPEELLGKISRLLSA